MPDNHPRTPGPHWATQGLYEQVAGGVIAGVIVAVATVLMTQNLWLGLIFAALTGTCLLCKLKTKLEQAFTEEIDRLNLEE